METGAGPNVLDAVLVLLLVLVALRGWRQGAVSQLAALGGLALGLLVGVWAAPLIAGALFDEPGAGTGLVTVVVLLVAVLVGQGAGLAVGARLHRVVHRLRVGVVDRVVGVAVGASGFLVAVWLLAGVLGQGPFPALAQQVRGSQLVAALNRALPPAPDIVGRISTYLDRQGFPQVFAGPGITVPSAAPPGSEAVQAAAAAGQPSTVQVLAFGCGARGGAGSGFVTRPGFVVTNAHVVAGFGQVRVRDTAGEHPATVVSFDPRLDVAVLAVDDLEAPPIGWTDSPAVRGTEGATLGFPGGQRQQVVRPATVQGRLDAVGRDIYGAGQARREIIVLTAPVEQGDSGGPFVTSDGGVGGVVFAGDPGGGATGYALTAEEVRPEVDAAIAQDQEVGVGECRF